jgi:hypothetical protein
MAGFSFATRPTGNCSMAARLNPRHSEMVRQKIQASCIIDRLHKCVKGEVEMTPTQVTAALGLLDRSVPKLSAIQMTGAEGGPLETVFRWASEKS